MAFLKFDKFIDNIIKVALVCICIALILICVKLVISPTTIRLISKYKDSHAEDEQFISTTTMRTNTMTAEISTNPSLYWTTDSHFTIPRAFYGAVVFSNGSVMACGGLINSTTVIRTCDVYTSSNTWMNGPLMNSPRAHYTLTSFAQKTKILAAGTAQRGYEQTAEVYDMASGKWTYTSMNMTAPRYLHSAMLLQNEKILIMGGIDNSDNPLSSAELFLPSSNAFTRTNSMRVARVLFTSTLLSDGLTILVTGGESINHTLVASAELYTSDSWTLINNKMIVPRSRHAAVLLRDGNVLIAGGDNGTAHSHASAEIYNATTRTFTPVGSMKYPRALFTLTLLPSGKVLATGGADWSTLRDVPISELYDPVTQTWSVTRALNTGRFFPISILLNDSVLTMGGVGAGNNYLASCEKYYF